MATEGKVVNIDLSAFYKNLDPKDAAILRDRAGIIRGVELENAKSLLRSGQALIEAKERCPPRKWGWWLETEFGYSDQYARNQMHLATRFTEEDIERYEGLDASVLYLIAAPSATQELQDEVCRRYADGERLTVMAVKALRRQFGSKRTSATKKGAAPPLNAEGAAVQENSATPRDLPTQPGVTDVEASSPDAAQTASNIAKLALADPAKTAQASLREEPLEELRTDDQFSNQKWARQARNMRAYFAKASKEARDHLIRDILIARANGLTVDASPREWWSAMNGALDREKLPTSASTDLSRAANARFFRTSEQWRRAGLQVVRSDCLALMPEQLPGLALNTAIDAARNNARRVWVYLAHLEAGSTTQVHTHSLENSLYVVSGALEVRWGSRLEYVARAAPGDFIFVPDNVPHQETNLSPRDPVEFLLVRPADVDRLSLLSGVEPAETAEEIYWDEPMFPASQRTPFTVEHDAKRPSDEKSLSD